jgi:hypothetical protein
LAAGVGVGVWVWAVCGGCCCAADGVGWEAGEEGVAANAGLDFWASLSGIEAGELFAVSSPAPPCFGGLVSCIRGRAGDWIGVVMEVSGVEALRGAGGGCDGRV